MRKSLAELRGPSGMLAGASLVARVAMMVNLVVAAHFLGWESFAIVAYALAVAAAVQTFVDPNSFNLLIANWHAWSGELRRGSLVAGIRLQTLSILAGVVVTVAIVAAAHVDSAGLALAASAAALAGCEGMARLARVTWQFGESFGRYAGADLVIACGRIVTAVTLIASPSLSTYCIANFAACLIPLAVVPVALRALGPGPAERYRIRRLARDVLPYGASTALSSFYAQAPGVMIGVLGNVTSAAVYAVAVRIAQSVELVPAAIANARFARLARTDDDERMQVFRAQRKLAALGGVAIAATIVAASPLLLALFRISWSDGGPVLAILALALVPKFLSYQFVALAMAQHRIVQRLRASAVVALLCVVLVTIAVPHGPSAVALASLASECTLLALLVGASGIRRQRLVPEAA